MIKIDMNMPRECHECPLQLCFKDDIADDWYNRRCVIAKKTIEYPRPKWCPLIENDKNIYKIAIEKEFKWLEEDIEICQKIKDDIDKRESNIGWSRTSILSILERLGHHYDELDRIRGYIKEEEMR